MPWVAIAIELAKGIWEVGHPIIQMINQAGDEGRELTPEEAASVRAGLDGALAENRTLREQAQARIDNS